MIFMYKDSCYCLTDWLTMPSGLMISRRVIGTHGEALENNYIGFSLTSYLNGEYILCASGALIEPLDLYVMYNKEALVPVRKYDNGLIKAKDQIDDFLGRIDKLRAFI
jgi:hypothetical protein